MHASLTREGAQMTVPTHWFRVKRAAAMGIVSGIFSVWPLPLSLVAQVVSGASLSGVIYPIMLSRLFNSVGFPWAVRIMAFMNFGIQAAAIPLVKERMPHRLGLPLVDFKAFSDLTFLFHVIGGFLAPFGAVPFLADSHSHQLTHGVRRTVHTVLVHRAVQPLDWYQPQPVFLHNCNHERCWLGWARRYWISRRYSKYILVVMLVNGTQEPTQYGRFNVTIPILVLAAVSSMAIWTTSKGTAETIIFSIM